MALTEVDFVLWRQLRDEGLLPDKPRVLEFGQSNWYCDVAIPDLAKVVAEIAAPEDRDRCLAHLDVVGRKETINLFEVAKVFWTAVLQPETFHSVDLRDSTDNVKLDLNQPLPLPLNHYDILINSGTAEHIFDQRQFWKSAHDHTKPGGLMVHAVPLHGWLDHGFVNYHPTFIADLAVANGYEALRWWYAEILPTKIIAVQNQFEFREIANRFGTRLSAMMYVVFRKPAEAKDFVTPFQGYYVGRLNEEQKDVWSNER